MNIVYFIHGLQAQLYLDVSQWKDNELGPEALHLWRLLHAQFPFLPFAEASIQRITAREQVEFQYDGQKLLQPTDQKTKVE